MNPFLVFCYLTLLGRRVEGNLLRLAIRIPNALVDAGILNETPAHDAGSGIGEPPIHLQAGDVDGAAQHISAGSGDNGVGLGMDRAARLVPLTLA